MSRNNQLFEKLMRTTRDAEEQEQRERDRLRREREARIHAEEKSRVKRRTEWRQTRPPLPDIEPGTCIWRAVLVDHDSYRARQVDKRIFDYATCYGSEPVVLMRQTDRGSYMLRAVDGLNSSSYLCDGWVAGGADERGPIIFLDKLPPPGWTHLRVTRVTRKKADGHEKLTIFAEPVVWDTAKLLKKHGFTFENEDEVESQG